jgi:dTDP-4-dehydrorhamnose 3,5-epimerase
MKIISEQLNGIVVLEPTAFGDERGVFMETFKASVFSNLGLPVDFVQDNHSISKKGVIRGMHFQWEKPMGKLIRVTNGRAFFAEADIRPSSPTLSKWYGIELSSENKLIMWVPPGFANGFCALEDNTVVQYKCTAEWNKSGEGSINWNDQDLAINWNFENPIVSEKDKYGIKLKDWLGMPESKLLKF